ncbi:hypothetical protein IJ096_03265 [Candidatus Saccharibacteria bacterium]|nr:hypothetical protein [Candidatus Saccharibacteria bacterium]
MKTPLKSIMNLATKGHTRADYLHSSSYAKAQNGGRMGVASSHTQSFAQRQKLDQNRTLISKYGDTTIARRTIGQDSTTMDVSRTRYYKQKMSDKSVGIKREQAIVEAVNKRKALAAQKSAASATKEEQKSASAALIAKSTQQKHEQYQKEQSLIAAAKEKQLAEAATQKAAEKARAEAQIAKAKAAREAEIAKAEASREAEITKNKVP